jgi:ABC-2 type transport system permease protein
MNSVTLSAAPARRTPARTGLYLREARAELVRSLRMPEFALPTLLLPIAFYWLFGVVLARPGTGTAGYLLATYGVFAAMGPALFGFGAGVGHERADGVLALKQISPLPAGAYLFAKLAATFAFAAIVLFLLYALGAWAGGVALDRGAWLALFALHLACVLPFGLLGLGVGLTLKGGGAVAVSNLLFLVLAVLGGLWVPTFVFPAAIQTVATVLPSWHLAEIALAIVGRAELADVPLHAGAVATFTIVCGLYAAWAWRRLQK